MYTRGVVSMEGGVGIDSQHGQSARIHMRHGAHVSWSVCVCGLIGVRFLTLVN